MATQFDEHGKIFTNVVSKKTIRAKIQTASESPHWRYLHSSGWPFKR